MYTGVFRCEISEKMEVSQSIFIGVYPNRNGLGSNSAGM